MGTEGCDDFASFYASIPPPACACAFAPTSTAGKRCVLIDGPTFIARFLQHVLPPGWYREDATRVGQHFRKLNFRSVARGHDLDDGER